MKAIKSGLSANTIHGMVKSEKQAFARGEAFGWPRGFRVGLVLGLVACAVCAAIGGGVALVFG